MDESYHTSVFINCPYDEEYYRLLRPMLFVLVSAGLTPIMAADSQDGGSDRLRRILSEIKRARFSIHDLSRTESARYNMPFEFGLDFACKHYAETQYGDKVFLLLEKEKYLLKRIMSDTGGLDARAHNDDPRQATRIVREWVVGEVLDPDSRRAFPGADRLMQEYEFFQAENNELLVEQGHSDEDIADRSIAMLVDDMRVYIELKQG
ncbi:MAG: hypothetical protein FWD45_03870 [Coriobacteriia bacterium]|nr:hypothetical protein [Coriobacteriia bacterium]